MASSKTPREPVPFDGHLMTIMPGAVDLTGRGEAVRPDHQGGSPGLSHLKVGPDDQPPAHVPEAGRPQVSGTDGALELAHMADTNPAPEPREC